MKEGTNLQFDAEETLHRGTDFMLNYDQLKLRAQQQKEMDMELLDNPHQKNDEADRFFQINLLMH